MSDDIDWSQAPEGATHYDAACTHPWLRDGTFPEYFRHTQWVRYDPASVGRTHIHRAVPRPPISEGPLRAEEFDHLVEPDWSKAPKGATHYNPDCVYPWLRATPAAYFIDGMGWMNYAKPAHAKRALDGAVPRPTPQPETLGSEPARPDNLAVDGFANAMRLRLSACRAAGRSGWDDPEQCPPQRLAEGLVRAVRAGKLVDVGNYAMMLWKRLGYPNNSAPPADLLRDALQPEPVEWDGTGMPPVGTVCEFNAKYRGWVAVTIAAHVTKRSGTPFVLFDQGDDYWHWEGDPKRLRPIRTAEQRAAKERDEAVAAMLDSSGLSAYDNVTVQQVCEALHAAGWCKTEGE